MQYFLHISPEESFLSMKLIQQAFLNRTEQVLALKLIAALLWQYCANIHCWWTCHQTFGSLWRDSYITADSLMQKAAVRKMVVSLAALHTFNLTDLSEIMQVLFQPLSLTLIHQSPTCHSAGTSSTSNISPHTDSLEWNGCAGQRIKEGLEMYAME